MSVSTATMRTGTADPGKLWIKDRKWDLTYISLGAFLVPLPYVVYLLIQNMPLLAGYAATFDTTADDISRQVVNVLVAIVVGGPHMYATFTRTALDADFRDRFRPFVWASIIIPLIVIGLALFNTAALVAIFFMWASIHVLHQIIYIVEIYNVKDKARTTLTKQSRAIDYAIVLTSLYPLAFYRMAQGTFVLGPFDVGAEVGGFVGSIVPFLDGIFFNLLFYAASLAFGLSFLAFTVKSIKEIQEGIAHIPKIVFVYATAITSFLVAALPNLDTAFQGMNVWHSFQYLALTWYINNLRHESGQLKPAGFVDRMSKKGTARKFYMFNVGLTIADSLLAVVIFFALRSTGMDFKLAFEKAYYIAVLSFLWIHYYHDHILFTEPKAADVAA